MERRRSLVVEDDLDVALGALRVQLFPFCNLSAENLLHVTDGDAGVAVGPVHSQ